MAEFQDKLSEEDVKRLHITPAIESKWNARDFRMEVPITAGRYDLSGNVARRAAPKRADYVLFLDKGHNYPIAVVEAKDMTHDAADGIQQAIDYAKMLDAPFAYSSNGQEFFEHDMLGGKERRVPLARFPSRNELVQRYHQAQNDGQGVNELQLRLQNQAYYMGTSEDAREPRYYQRVAINRTLDRIACGQNRLLLVMATGTGKTYAAFQIVWRLLKSGVKSRILYLADRNVLVDQSINQDFRPLEKTIHKVAALKEDRAKLSSYPVCFSLYQQLVGDDGQERYRDLFKPDDFDLVIVDECHRGSAKANSLWRKILEYFSSATQLGMTATPKETEDVSNIDYFGEPVYTYSLKDGIDDGFLAPFRVRNYVLDVGQGWAPAPGQLDKFGKPIENRVYDNKDFDRNIVIEPRIQKAAEIIADYLKETDRMQRTIVFCETEDHALRMREALVNLNADMVAQNPDYVVRITANDDVGKSKLSYFISVGEAFPVIATTSQLLSTGVDCKTTKLIVLDKNIASMTEFKQIVGRGTRLRPDVGKTDFVVMDFRGVTRHFTDPDWDGPVEIVDGFTPLEGPNGKRKRGSDHESKEIPIVDSNGCQVELVGEQRYVYDPQTGRPILENVIDYAKRNIYGEYLSLEGFVRQWRANPKKTEIRDMFIGWGIDLDALKAERQMTEYDDFDFVCHLAFDQTPKSRKERAEQVRKSGFFDRYDDAARQILEALLDKYAENGVYEIEDLNVLKVEPFVRIGKPTKIVKTFGDKNDYFNALKELEQAIYSGTQEQA